GPAAAALDDGVGPQPVLEEVIGEGHAPAAGLVLGGGTAGPVGPGVVAPAFGVGPPGVPTHVQQPPAVVQVVPGGQHLLVGQPGGGSGDGPGAELVGGPHHGGVMGEDAEGVGGGTGVGRDGAAVGGHAVGGRGGGHRPEAG